MRCGRPPALRQCHPWGSLARREPLIGAPHLCMGLHSQHQDPFSRCELQQCKPGAQARPWRRDQHLKQQSTLTAPATHLESAKTPTAVSPRSQWRLRRSIPHLQANAHSTLGKRTKGCPRQKQPGAKVGLYQVTGSMRLARDRDAVTEATTRARRVGTGCGTLLELVPAPMESGVASEGGPCKA